MNVERLHSILWDLDQEVSDQNVIQLLKQFQRTFNQSVMQPNQQTSDAFIAARTNLAQALEESVANSFSPSSAGHFAAIGGEQFFGSGLLKALQSIIDANTSTPGQAVEKIKEHNQKADEYYAAVKAANESLEKLNIDQDYTQKDEYEVGILLPNDLFNNNIDELSAELHILNRHLKVFGEIAGDDTSSPTIRSVSNSSLELFLNALPDVAGCIADAIQYIVVMYLTILEIRKHREGLKKKKVPKEVLAPVVDHEKQRVSEELERIAGELLKKHRKKPDNTRDKELRGHLLHALTYLAKRLDQGAGFEVTPPQEFEKISNDASEKQKKESKAQRQRASQMLKKGQAVTQLPERAQQILSLLDKVLNQGENEKPQQSPARDK